MRRTKQNYKEPKIDELNDMDDNLGDGDGPRNERIVDEQLPFFLELHRNVQRVDLGMLTDEDGGLSALLVLLNSLPPVLLDDYAEITDEIEDMVLNGAHLKRKIKPIYFKSNPDVVWRYDYAQTLAERKSEIVVQVGRIRRRIVRDLDKHNMLYKGRSEMTGGEL
jgi:hypothetical protein